MLVSNIGFSVNVDFLLQISQAAKSSNYCIGVPTMAWEAEDEIGNGPRIVLGYMSVSLAHIGLASIKVGSRAKSHEARRFYARG